MKSEYRAAHWDPEDTSEERMTPEAVTIEMMSAGNIFVVDSDGLSPSIISHPPLSPILSPQLPVGPSLCVILNTSSVHR